MKCGTSKTMNKLNKQILVILAATCIISHGFTAYAEPSSSTETSATTGLFSGTRPEIDKRFHLDLEASGSYGRISGYMQTPLGGMPFSTSGKRPRFEELDIDTAPMVNLSLSASKDPHLIYVAAHLADLSGESTLGEALIFHGRGYPAGTRVKANTRWNWYEIGYQYNIHLGNERVDLSIAPIVACTLFDFSVELDAQGEKNNRSYTQATPRIGLGLEWFPWSRFSVYGKAIGSLPFDNMPHIYTIGLTGKYRVINQDCLKISLVMGVEYNQIDYKDSQATPNHVRANIGPSGIVGAEIRF